MPAWPATLALLKRTSTDDMADTTAETASAIILGGVKSETGFQKAEVGGGGQGGTQSKTTGRGFGGEISGVITLRPSEREWSGLL